ncbi:1-deoxypentalenic acid 11-beta-hydroxylase-like [Crassostrea virginica]
MARRVALGTREVSFPSEELQQLRDSNHLLNNPEALRKELHEKGYLFIRGFHNREEVLQARLSILEYVNEKAEFKLLDPPTQGVLDERCGRGCIPFMEGKNNITHSPVVLRVLEGQRPRQFFRRFFDTEARTFDFKWLRGINRRQFTGAHVDNVYMGRGSKNLYTVWTPFGDTSVEMGTLAVCEGSNCLPSFRRLQDTYGELDMEREGVEGTGWFTEDPFEITTKFGGKWKTSDFQAGDVLIFTVRTVHMSTSNLTDNIRLSCDTRWQPADEEADPRFVGQIGVVAPKFGLFGKEQVKAQTIDDLKQSWGI